MKMYRLFIAAELPPPIKAELISIQSQLQRDELPISWVAPGAMHLTLRFVGDTHESLLPELKRALQDGLASHNAMILQLDGVGAFPNTRRPNVVWAGVGGAVAALQHAQADIEQAVAGLGIAPDPKPFRPHLTLGRLRRGASPQQQQQLGNAIRALLAPAPLEWLAERIVLFRSELRSGGPVYTEMDAIALSQKSASRSQETK